MNIDILCVGKIKEKFYTDAVNEYVKRLGRYCNINIISVQDEKTPDKISDNMRDIILEKEAERLLKYMKDNALKAGLVISGQALDSEGFAEVINDAALYGKSHIQFIIGGSLGLHKSILDKCNMHISFSKMTFPHQLMRVILTEQIYRAYRIINKEPYHK